MNRAEVPGNGRRSRLLRWIGIAPILVLQAACAVTPLSDINTKYRQALEERLTEYRIKPGDTLRIDLFAQEYQGPPHIEVTVRPDGRGDILFLPDHQLAGRTVQEVRQELVEPIRGLFRDAVFTIQVVATGEQVFLVGQFETPGVVALHPGMTLGMAVSAVGGVKVTADTDYAELSRPYRDSEHPDRFRIDLGDASGELLLLPGDQVYLGRTFFASVVAYWQEYVLGFVDVRLVFGKGDF